MEVIKLGKIPECRTQVTCQHCGTIIEVEPSEAVERWGDNLLFRCPLCKRNIYGYTFFQEKEGGGE